IVIDLDLATKLDDPLLALGTHVVASTEALFAMAGLKDYGAALKRLAEHLSGFVAITDGPKGAYWLEHGELKHLPAFKGGAIDSLGGGDAFHGGYVLCYCCGRVCGKDGRWPIFFALPAPLPRLNAQNSGAPPQRQRLPKWRHF